MSSSNTNQHESTQEPVLEMINGEEYEVVEEVVEEEYEEEEEEEEEGEEEQEGQGVIVHKGDTAPQSPQQIENIGKNGEDRDVTVADNKNAKSDDVSQQDQNDQKQQDQAGKNFVEQGAEKAAEDGVMNELNIVKDLAANAAKDVSARALDISSKVQSGLVKGFSQLRQPGAVANSISSWWSNLDPKPVSGSQHAASVIGRAPSNELALKLGLEEHENLMEEFKCKILQTMTCNHNDFTPPIQMAFPGILYITDRRTCFELEERKSVVPKFKHSDVAKATRRGPARKGEKNDILFIQFNNSDRYVSFKDFDNSQELDSALALIEHLMSEAKTEL
eukprot:TRINITY_DN829_c0_g1_i2.p1 TRINITY_DN829_c0_g1~~TRINITY_DN829_c0_g1_i2.p1  ORF type:complete len:369 (-),score=63.94 TRINITY_DN829_c0_g1_i2:219-1220(-)